MKHTLIILLAAIYLTACSTTPAPMTAALPSPTIALTQTPVPTLTLTPAPAAGETTVTAGSEAALMGLPAGSEIVGDNYVYHAKTGDVVVGKVVGGKVEAEEFFQYKIYATAEEAWQHPWPIRLDENGKPVGPFMKGGPGNVCQLSAEPLPETVVTGKDVELLAFQNPGGPIQLEALRWGKDAQRYYDQHPEDLSVKFCGFAAAESPFEEAQKSYMGMIWQWKTPGGYVYITLVYNRALFIAEDLGNKKLLWPKRRPLDRDLNPTEQSRLLTASILRDPDVYEEIGKWGENDYPSPDLQKTVLPGTMEDVKAK